MRRAKLLAALAVVVLVLNAGCHHHRRVKKEKAGPSEVVPVATLYAKGQAAMQKKKPATARRYFDQIALREDAGEYKDKAAIATADTYFLEHTLESYAEAISRYQAFLAFHPTHAAAAYCQYKIGLAYFEEMETPDRDTSPAYQARDAFQALIENYPSCEYVADAKEKITEVEDLLAAHEIKVGDFYVKNKDYKGAVARYRTVLEKYPKYWNKPAVDYRLADALYRDGQDKEAMLYYKRVVQEAPDTSLAKSAQKNINRIQKQEVKKGGKEGKAMNQPLTRPKNKSKYWWQFWK